MAFDKMMQNLGRGITGNAVKAVLCIRSPEAAKKENVPDKTRAAEEMEKAIKDVNAVNDSLMKRAEKSLNGKADSATYSDVKAIAEKNRYIALEVQFNPSSLRLSTTAGMQTKYGDDITDLTMQTVPTPAATDLSFELLFDDVNSQDAYMLEGNVATNFSVGNLYQTGKDAVRKLSRDKYSVQRQMDGLMAMLSIDSARNVIFFWADMSFRGEVTALSNTYTMFNKDGYPIRGRVGMTIRQGDGSDGADPRESVFKYNEAYWKKAFDRIFSDKIPGSGGGILSNNNLLNLKL